MKTTKVVLCLLLSSGWLVACGGDDTANPVPLDGGADATTDGGKDGAAGDGGAEGATDGPRDGAGEAATDTGPDAPVDGGDAGPPAQRVLVTYGIATSQLYAVDIATRMVVGALPFPDAFGTPFSTSIAPFLLQQQNDLVERLDPYKPWIPTASWTVGLNDKPDGGYPNAEPAAVLVSAGNKAYVLRYNRNTIAVIDPSQMADGGMPSSTIDLSLLVQPTDSDGTVEMTSGAYDPASKLLFVVLGNIDKTLVVNMGKNLLCGTTTSSIIAIDTMTDQVHSLGGSAPGGGVPLTTFDPVLGVVAVDKVGGRILFGSSGCNVTEADGGLSPLTKAGIEAYSFAGGTPQLLHDGSADGFPSGLVYVDTTHAVVGYDFYGMETHYWDPTQTSLGMLVPNGPDQFAYDGTGNLVGTLTSYPADGGMLTDVVQVRLSDGMLTTLASNPFPMGGGFVGGVDVWPHP